MELNTISGLAIAGVICSVVLSMGVPIALFIAGRVKLKARISSFFIGAGTYLLFAMLLEQQLHVLVIQFCGLNAQSRPWLYYVYAALAAAVFEETGRLIAMKFWMKKWLDFPNALMYGIGHGGVEAILIGGLSGISNLVSMLMINSGAMQNTLAALPAESANQTVSQLSALWTTPAPLFCKRNRKNQCHHSAYRVVTADLPGGKGRQMQDSGFYRAVLAYGIHFYRGLLCRGRSALLPIYVIEIGVFVMAAGTLVMALKMEGWKKQFQFSAIIKQNISDRTHRRNTVFFAPFLMIGYSINFIYYPQYLKKLLLQVNLTEVAFYLSIIFISFQNHFIKIQKLFCYIISSLTFNIQ